MEEGKLKKRLILLLLFICVPVSAQQERRIGSWNAQVERQGIDYVITVKETNPGLVMNHEFDVYTPEMDGTAGGNYRVKARALLGEGSYGSTLCIAYAYWHVDAVTIETIAQIPINSRQYTYIDQTFAAPQDEMWDSRLIFYLSGAREKDSYRIGEIEFFREAAVKDGLPHECCDSVPSSKTLLFCFEDSLEEASVTRPGNVQINNSVQQIERVELLSEKTVTIRLKKKTKNGLRYIVDFLDIKTEDGAYIAPFRRCFTVCEEENLFEEVLERGARITCFDGAVRAEVDALFNAGKKERTVLAVLAGYERGLLKEVSSKTIALRSGESVHGVPLSLACESDAYRLFLHCGGIPLIKAVSFP